MRWGLADVRRAKLKFGLLVGAVSLLVFLVLFLSTLSSALVQSFIGTLQRADADVVVYSATARDNLQASRLTPAVTDTVRRVPGVAEAAGVGSLPFSAKLPGGKTEEMLLFGVAADGPGRPAGLTAGRLATSPGEVAVDAAGLKLGDRVTLPASGTELTVVGLLRGARFAAADTGYVAPATYEGIVRATNPNLPFVPRNFIAVRTVPGADPGQVANAIGAQVLGTKGYTREDAIAAVPGVGQVRETFNILVAITFGIAVVVIGFFFLILTVQRLKVFTLLRAVGASPRWLARGVIGQVTLVVALASVLAVALTALAVRGANTGIPVELSPWLVGGTILATEVAAVLAGLVSVSRIRRLDPAAATGAR